MTSSTVNTILTSGVTAINDYLSTLLPVVIPVAVGLAALFFIAWWIVGAQRRRF